jgi:ABC-type polysaccharide/polyol phosphate export permease
MTSAVQFFQHAFVSFPPPGIAMIAVNSSITLFVLAIGIVVFQSESKFFDDWL